MKIRMLKILKLKTPCQIFIILSIIISLTFSSITYAELKIYNGYGEYRMSEFEEVEVAKEIARLYAEQDVQKQAGIFFKSYSYSMKSRLIEDEIIAITGKISQINDVQYEYSPSADGKFTIYKAKIKAIIDTNEFKKQVYQDKQKLNELIAQSKDLEMKISEQMKLLEELNFKVADIMTEQDKEQIKNEYSKIDKKFLAIQKFNEGNKLYKRNNYIGAIDSYNLAIQYDPNFAWAYNKRALSYVEMKNYDKAMKDFDRAIQLDSNSADIYLNRSDLYGTLEDYEHALEDCNKALKLNSQNSIAYIKRGALNYYILGNYERAMQDFNKATQIDPGDARVYYARGKTYNSLECYVLAIKDYDKAIQLIPDSPICYFERGISYKNLKKYDEAISDFTKTIQFDENETRAYYGRGLSYLNLKKNLQAIEDFNKVISINPTSEVYNDRALAYFGIKKYDKAIEDFNNGIKMNPSDANIYAGRSLAYFSLNDYIHAIEDCDKVIQLNPNRDILANAHYLRGTSYLKLGESEKAIEDIIKANKLGYKI